MRLFTIVACPKVHKHFKYKRKWVKPKTFPDGLQVIHIHFVKLSRKY